MAGQLMDFARLSVLSGASTINATISDGLENATPSFGNIQELLSSWFQVDFTTLAVILTIFGTISGALKDLHGVALKVYWSFTKLCTASISIASNDRLNREIINWLGANILTKQDTRILTARSEVVENDAYGWQSRKIERNELYEKRIPIQFLPTFGTTWFIFNGTVFLVRRVSSSSRYATDNQIPDEYADAPEGNEPLIIMCLGRSVTPIKKFLEICRDFAEQQRETFTTIRASKNTYGEDSWDTTILRPIRPLSTVHFDEKTKQELVADIRNYLDPKTRKFYTSRGIPYRRGFLLYGTPGTGKTSLSLALAGCFGLELYLVHLPGIKEDSELTKMFTSLPPRCIVLLEDIDAVGMKRQPAFTESDNEEEDEEDEDDSDDDDRSYNRSRCTLSGLLNVLDGVASQEGRIVLMTSNHAEKLDKALVRPGRIDRKIYLGPVSQRSAELMFLRMYAPDPTLDLNMKHGFGDGELEKLALKFSQQLTDDTFTPAQLQGYLLNFRDEPARAAEEIRTWVVEETQKMNDQKAKEKKIRAWRAEKKRTKKLDSLNTEDKNNIREINRLANGLKEKKEETVKGEDILESEANIVKEEDGKDKDLLEKEEKIQGCM